jgi:hypothetical protein
MIPIDLFMIALGVGTALFPRPPSWEFDLQRKMGFEGSIGMLEKLRFWGGIAVAVVGLILLIKDLM